MGGTGKKPRWKISIYRSTTRPSTRNLNPPPEFICPISGSLMSDPVIVSTGQTFERACVTACKTLDYNPVLPDGSEPDLAIVIPNLALKSSISNWVRDVMNVTALPKPLEVADAMKLVRAESELSRRSETLFDSGESTPLELATRPSSYSSCSSGSEMEVGACEDDGEYVWKMRSVHVYDKEEGVASLRKGTKSSEELRVKLCSNRLLSALRPLITSKYTNVQVNSVAALVNLSLEKLNKVKIVRAGFVPPLIDLLRGRFPEVQEHACGALFSLALDDANKTAIGVLGALQPLIHIMMRSDSNRARHDASLALYHLSLVQSNRLKLVKLGSVALFLGMLKSAQMPGRALLILCNLAACNEGRAAMLDAGAVEFFVGLLRKGEFDSESTRESCVAVICALGHGGGLRFRVLAKAAGAVEMLREVAETTGRERARDKARRVLEILRERDEEEEDVDWEKVLEFGFPSRTVAPVGGQPCRNSTEF